MAFSSMSLKSWFKSHNGQLDKMYVNTGHVDEVDAATGTITRRSFFILCCPNGQIGPNGENLSVSVGLSKNLAESLKGSEALRDRASFLAWCKANKDTLEVTHADGTKIPSMFFPGEGYVSDFWD